MKTFLKILYCIGYAIMLFVVVITSTIATIVISVIAAAFSPIIAIVGAIMSKDVDVNVKIEDNHCPYYVEGKDEEKF